ncbi:MAG: polysaccharide deacetylase family protein [Clostridia bacterium]|nr:polysaccharide deacetylase family protein [Clostridia bacterium]
MKIKRVFWGLLQKTNQLILKLKNGNIYVCMFHGVYSDLDEKTNLDIQKESFSYFIDSLINENVSFISANEILKSNKSKKNFIFTFDDVYENVVLNAIPILNRYNIPFTLFISEKLVDEKGYITSKQINELKNNPLCTIGYHTKNHLMMRELSNNEIITETDCSDFEKKYGIKCNIFAYPYGSMLACSKKSTQIIKNSKNYAFAFCTINGSTNVKTAKKRRFFIPRINVCDGTFEAIIKRIHRS